MKSQCPYTNRSFSLCRISCSCYTIWSIFNKIFQKALKFDFLHNINTLYTKKTSYTKTLYHCLANNFTYFGAIAYFANIYTPFPILLIILPLTGFFDFCAGFFPTIGNIPHFIFFVVALITFGFAIEEFVNRG